ncbi:hypothetical protein [Limnohabitans sp. Jir72]|uniref:hypothetical protein n=1 Tax=Limnohabitans sp. Jir72 TaxID=1977909 RepID=UPI0011B2548A|nr:hypothetical protein [Limnohabitans sp. Jir72]
MSADVTFLPPLDTVHWSPALALTRLDGDDQLLASVIALMRSVLIRELPVLLHCIQIRDCMRIRQLTHAQLPSLKILGFDKPAEIFERFESVALKSDWQACEHMMPSIEMIWTRIIDALGQHLQTQD